jgi:hypothetical protein
MIAIIDDVMNGNDSLSLAGNSNGRLVVSFVRLPVSPVSVKLVFGGMFTLVAIIK